MGLDMILDPIEAEIRNAFVLKKHFLDEAQKILHDIADDYRKKQTKKTSPKITFVGLHIRST
jgi:hypothetical protein